MKLHLVTGGSGFLGTKLVHRLWLNGDRVRILDTAGNNWNRKAIEFVQGDICDRDTVRMAMNGVDVVHHLAALVPLSKAGHRFELVNNKGSEIVAREAGIAGVKRFVYVSSSTVYGLPPELPITSLTPRQPVEAYGRSKLDGETNAKHLSTYFGMSFLSIRPRTIIGPERMGIFQLLFDWIADDKTVFMLGDGSNKFQFIHVDDFIDAYLLLLERGQRGFWNVGTPHFGTLGEAIASLIYFASSSSKIVHLPVWPAKVVLRLLSVTGLMPLAPWHYLSYAHPFHFDVQDLIRLGWKPRYSNDRALHEAYHWYITNRYTLGQRSGSVHQSSVKKGLLKWIR